MPRVVEIQLRMGHETVVIDGCRNDCPLARVGMNRVLMLVYEQHLDAGS